MLFLNTERLETARAQSRLSENALARALELLLQNATEVLDRPLRTVMDKALLPPSGDRHDYFSFGPYWWTNPSTPDGLPYVRRDGEVNPEVEQTDFAALRELLRDTQTLALAYFYSGEEKFARDAARRLCAWFLDEATRMNPHLQFAQAIPGICDGRGIGIIDTTALCLLPDSLELLQPSLSWTASDQQQMREWLACYLDWLLHSTHGQDEARERNNHGTWYDAQVATLALACNQRQVAREILEKAPQQRFALQIAADGSQPHELTRTRSFTYSCFNLSAMFHLATLAPRVELDLWNWKSVDGACLQEPCLQKALEFLSSYAGALNAWPYPQLQGDDESLLFDLLHRAPENYRTLQWQTAREKAQPHAATWWKTSLLWPVEY